MGWHSKNIIDLCTAEQHDEPFPATYNSSTYELTFSNASSFSGNSYSSVQVQTYTSRTDNFTAIIREFRNGNVYASFTKSGTTQNTFRIKANGNKADSGYYFTLDNLPDGEYTISINIKSSTKSSTANTTGPYAYENFVVNRIQIEYGGDFTQFESPRTITSTSQNISQGNHTLRATWKENVSYLSSDWATRVFSSDAEANAVKSIIFTKDASKISGLGSSISLGTNSPTSTAAYTQTAGVEDVKAYYNDKTSIVIYSPRTIYAPQDSQYLFCRGTSSSGGLTALTSLDVSNFDTSKVTNMPYMFYSCSALTSLNVSNFDTSNVTDMASMFNDCRALTSLDLSNFDTSKVTNMPYMFYSCSALTSLNVSNFDTSKVTDMSSMFRNCSALTSLDVSNFDTSKVTDMSSMFRNCSALTSLDVSNFDTSNVTDMASMFNDCRALTSLDVSNFDTSNVTDMSSMVDGCESLTSLDLSNFDTSNVTDMYAMFYNCIALTSLDVSSFDTSNVTDMPYMFNKCSALISLNLGNFNLQSCTDFDGMLAGCTNLEEIILPYNLQSGKTIDLPASNFYNGSAGPYSKIGTATSGTTVACSTASSKVTLRKK